MREEFFGTNNINIYIFFKLTSSQVLHVLRHEKRHGKQATSTILLIISHSEIVRLGKHRERRPRSKLTHSPWPKIIEPDQA